MMDELQGAIFVFLIAISIAAILLWLRQWWHLFDTRMKGKVGVMRLKDALAVVLLIPALLTGFIGALWIYRQGWEDFARVISITISFGFVGGVVLVLLFYLVNRASLRMMKGST